MTEFPQHANWEAGNQSQKGLSGPKSLQSSNLPRNSFFLALPSLSNPLRTIKDFRIDVVWKPRVNLSVFTCVESAERRNRKGSKFNVPVSQHIPGKTWFPQWRKLRWNSTAAGPELLLADSSSLLFWWSLVWYRHYGVGFRSSQCREENQQIWGFLHNLSCSGQY